MVVANAVLLGAKKDRRIDFADVYTVKDLEMIIESYTDIPAGIRSLLLGHVMNRVMTQAVIWTKCEGDQLQSYIGGS